MARDSSSAAQMTQTWTCCAFCPELRASTRCPRRPADQKKLVARGLPLPQSPGSALASAGQRDRRGHVGLGWRPVTTGTGGTTSCTHAEAVRADRHGPPVRTARRRTASTSGVAGAAAAVADSLTRRNKHRRPSVVRDSAGFAEVVARRPRQSSLNSGLTGARPSAHPWSSGPTSAKSHASSPACWRDQHHLDVRTWALMGSGRREAVVMALTARASLRGWSSCSRPGQHRGRRGPESSRARAGGLLDGRAIPAWDAIAARPCSSRSLVGAATGTWWRRGEAACSARRSPPSGPVASTCAASLVVDEAHHHNDRTRAGEHAAAVRSLGGAVLLVSGTPWHARGRYSPRRRRSCACPRAELARGTATRTGTLRPDRVARRAAARRRARDARAAVGPGPAAVTLEARGPKAAPTCARRSPPTGWPTGGRAP